YCFVQASPRRLDSLSFPTRRSSDLEELAEIQPLKKEVADQARTISRLNHETRMPASSTAWPSASTKSDLPLPDGPVMARHSARPDRKSTRLNSSHQIISYAVFCLKK